MRAATTITLLALVLAAPACDEGSPWGGSSQPPTDEVTPDFGPTAAYNRRIMFLGAGPDSPEAAVFDFIALSDSIGIRRGVRARVARDDAWRPLMDAGWEMGPMREPWRLVPHGPLTMVVGATGELGTLVLRDSVTTRLELGQTLAEHSPDIGTQLVLRSARLTLDGETVDGLALDAQLGRAVNPALAVRDNAPPAEGDTTADTLAPSPTPIAMPGAEALLLDTAGYYAILATASGGSLAWIRNGERNDIRAGTRLEPIAWSNIEDTDIQVPTSWRVVSADGELSGELTARAVDRSVLRGTGDLEALAYELVTGWIEDRSSRRNVYGLVRHVR